MARDRLRTEIRTITDRFHQEHPRLQVKATRSLDELTVVFKRKYYVLGFNFFFSLHNRFSFRILSKLIEGMQSFVLVEFFHSENL